MRPIDRIVGRKGSMTLGGTGGTFRQAPFWAVGRSSGDEDIEASFDGYCDRVYKADGVVFSCMRARASVFSEARFQYQRLDKGRPGDLFGDPSLALLENPWPNGTTGELLTRMEQDASLAGNSFWTTVDDEDGKRMRRLRPDAVTIVTGSRSSSDDDPFALDARVVGYLYRSKPGATPTLLLPGQVAHWSPIPDPQAQWRGMSWLQPIIGEVQADIAATKHKRKFFENGTVGSVLVTYSADTSQEEIEAFADLWRQAHAGTDNAYKAFHLGGGADAKSLGADLKQLDFKVTQGAGETRIAAAAGVPPSIVGLSEGLQGSSLNAGNFTAARRLFADATIRPNWRGAAAALQTLVTPPGSSRLWYDARDVPFLQEDQKDEAEIQSSQASTIAALIAAGYQPDAVVKAVTSGDLRLLTGQHSGLYSVQLQAAGMAQEGPQP